MCLVPGMLAPGPSRPSARAMKLATALQVLTGILLVASLGLITSFSVWAVLQNLVFVACAYMAVVRPFRHAEPLVFVENILCFALLSGFTGLLCTLSLVNLAMHKQLLSDILRPWQVYTGLTFFGIATAAFLLMSLFAILLFRDLRETTVQLDEESAPFIVGRRGDAAGRGSQRSASSFGSFGFPPTGVYASGSGSRTSTSTMGGAAPAPADASRERFPGKGYRLNE